MNITHTRSPVLVALLGSLALAPSLLAQPPDGDDITQTVVRVAYLSGQVSYSRGDSPDDWQPASRNFPMTLGDRLYTARGSRLELQTENGAIYLAPESNLAALNLTYDVKQFSLGMGSASFLVRQIGPEEFFEVDTPNAAVTFDRAGEYRIDVDRDGNTRVLVNHGHAYVAAAGGEVPLEAGRLMAIDGIDSPVYDVDSLPRPDSWDRWVETRSRRSRDIRSSRYVHAGISGVEDLDQYGSWSQIPEYGTCWSPSNVSAGWQPYRAGRWAWQDPWGWSWVSSEPWGWAPYHYGRWVTSRSRWYWVPVGPDVRSIRYAPALVMFVGGAGASLSVSLGGGGYVGWFPLAPRDPFVPWWGSRGRDSHLANVQNVTYVNRTYVTVVNQNTFISGNQVTTNTIRDARVLREISTAPVVRGPLPVVPVASSIRVSATSAGPAPRPPAAALTRPVVTHLAPAPAPALFREKTDLIRENRGAPVDSAQAARLSPTSRAIQPARSVVTEPGRSTLKPKNTQVSGPTPVPVTREATPGHVRREAPPAGGRDVSPGQVRGEPAPALDAKKAQEADTARKQQQQQQQLEAGKAQEADAARKQQQQQQQLEARKAQEADAARKQQQQQQQLEARKAQEADAARRQQPPGAKQKQVTEEKKAAPPTATPADQKKEKDEKSKDKKDQPDQRG